jgi:hypothetical protein
MMTTYKLREFQNSSGLGPRTTSRVGMKLSPLNSAWMQMRVVVGLEVSSKAPHKRMFLHVADSLTVETNSADMFPFIGSVPNRAGHSIAAGFAGHGKDISSPSIHVSD